MIRYGVLSTASIVPRFVGAVHEAANAEVVAIASRSREKADAMAKRLGIPQAYGSYEELLDDPSVDAVYVPLVNVLHYSLAKQALLVGKHVLVEKPMTLTAAEAEELFALGRERGLFVTETVKSPFLPTILDVRDVLASGTLGNVRVMEFKQSYAGVGYTAGWNRERAFGGGVWYGNEAYFLYLARLLAGEVVSFDGTATFGDSDVEEQCAVTLRLEGNVLATCAISSHVEMDNGLTIWCDKGRVEVPDYWKATVARVFCGDELVREIGHPCTFEMRYEVEHYSSCIERGLTESPVTSSEWTVGNLRLVEELYHRWGRTT